METRRDILLNKRDQEVHENVCSCFLRKNLIWDNLTFPGHFLMFDWVWPKLSQATVTIGSLKTQIKIKIKMTRLRSLNSHDMISQGNVYVVDTVLRYYVMFITEVNIQHRVICFREKILEC